jgi:hypothetical protein
MKRVVVLFAFVLSAVSVLQAQGNWSFKGTVVRMRMTDCVVQRGFMAAMSGTSGPAGVTCPEYTIVSDRVVYVVTGRRADEFMPLAENLDFMTRKNELITFSADERAKSRFTIQQMMLRSEWDRQEEHKDLANKMMEQSVDYQLRDPHLSPRASMVAEPR